MGCLKIAITWQDRTQRKCSICVHLIIIITTHPPTHTDPETDPLECLDVHTLDPWGHPFIFHVLSRVLFLKQEEVHTYGSGVAICSSVKMQGDICCLNPLTFPLVIPPRFTNRIQGPYPKVPRVNMVQAPPRFLLQAPPDPKHSTPTQFLSI